jgi:hypothetical protein
MAAATRPAGAAVSRRTLDGPARLVDAIGDELPKGGLWPGLLHQCFQAFHSFLDLPALVAIRVVFIIRVCNDADRAAALGQVQHHPAELEWRERLAQCLSPKMPRVEIQELLEFFRVGREQTAPDEETGKASLAARATADGAPLAPGLPAGLVLGGTAFVLLFVHTGWEDAGGQMDLLAVGVYPCTADRVGTNVET